MCPRFFFEIDLLRSAPCPLPGGVRGVCCPHILVLRLTSTGDLVIWSSDHNPTIMLKNIWWHWSHHREPEVEEDPWQKGCPSNIICPPKPPNVVIPNIRFEDITNLVNLRLFLIRNILYIRASDIRTASNIAKKNIVARQRLQVIYSQSQW